MSVFNDLQVVSNFYGVTIDKGDIIVNDGIKNANLPAGTDGYVLTADSTQTLGIKWAPSAGGGGGGSLTSTQKILSAAFSTNSTSPVILNDFTHTPTMGNHLILLNFTYSISRINQTLTIGLYKNGTLISDSIRALQTGGSNITLSFSSNFYTSFSGADILTVRVYSSSTTAVVNILYGSIIYSKTDNISQVYNGVVFLTNSTTPNEIADINSTITATGNYIVMINFVYGLSKLNRNFTVGIYINGSLVGNTLRVIHPPANLREVFQQNFIISAINTDIVSVRVFVSNVDTTLSIYERNVILIST